MRLLFLLSFLVSTLHLHAQDDLLAQVAPAHISGQWKGTLYQSEGNKLSLSYSFSLVLALEGQKITGSSTISHEGSSATIALNGTLNGNAVTLNETSVLNSKIVPTHLWCIKKMQLFFVYENGEFHLKGPWTGTSNGADCMPGSIDVVKMTIKA